MLIIDRKDGESIERMVRRYRRKHRDVRLLRRIRKRKHFTKPSVERRKEILKAAYRDRKLRDGEV